VKYALGLSATVVRKDGYHPIIFMQCGPVRADSVKAWSMSDRAQERRDHLDLLKQKFCRFARNVVVLKVGMTQRARKQAEAMPNASPTDERLVLATGWSRRSVRRCSTRYAVSDDAALVARNAGPIRWAAASQSPRQDLSRLCSRHCKEVSPCLWVMDAMLVQACA